MSYTINSKTLTNTTNTSSTTNAPVKSKLTPEQLQKIEENRQKALLKLKSKSNSNPLPTTNSTINPAHIVSANQATTLNKNIGNPSDVSKSTSYQATNLQGNIQTGTNFQNSSIGTKHADTSRITGNNSASSNVVSPPKGKIDQCNGKCEYLIDEPDRFEIKIGYNKEIIDLFKTLNGRKFDPVTKYWSFPIKSHDEIINKIKFGTKNVKIEPLEKNSNIKSKPAKFYLISRTRFEVQADYDQELQELFKTFQTKKYDPTLKRWSFDLKEYEDLIKKIGSQLKKGSIQITPLPKLVREVFKDALSGNSGPRIDPKYDMDLLKTKIDMNIIRSLLPFQIEGICFGIQQQGRLFLADDMGLGKTVQGLAIANFYKDEWPLFIIAPSSVKFMWKESIKRWMSNTIREICHLQKDECIDDYIYCMENGRQAIDSECKVVITSYELLNKNIDEISQVEYKVVIVDESHLLKTAKAARTKSATKLIENCKRLILLSGTPALSRPSELFSQLHLINPNLFNSFHDYGMRYCDGKETNFGWDFNGFSNMNELRLLMEEKLLMRREKKDVMQELPSKMRELVILNPSLIELNTKSLKMASTQMNNTHLNGSEKRSALLVYYNETCQVKAKAVCEYVNDLMNSGKKFIVFAHHQVMLNELEKLCVENKFDYIKIDGKTQSKVRQDLVNKFQTTETCQIALLSITAANSGITLTQAKLVVFAELFWNPGILVQAEDRVYRIGQKDSVNVQYLCAKGTADDEMWLLVKQKLNVLGGAGLTKENFSQADATDNFQEKSKKPSIFQELLDAEKEISTMNINEKGNEQNLDEDDLLNGIDLSKFDVPPTKKVKISDFFSN